MHEISNEKLSLTLKEKYTLKNRNTDHWNQFLKPNAEKYFCILSVPLKKNQNVESPTLLNTNLKHVAIILPYCGF